MPEMTLTGEYQEDLSMIMAFMLFPDDEKLRDVFRAQWILCHIYENSKDEEVNVPKSLLGLLLKELHEIRLMGYINISREKGYVAGRVLLCLDMLANEDQASLAKAKYIIEKSLKGAKTTDNKVVARSHQSVRNAWKKYLSVAHLWAAYVCICEKYRDKRGTRDSEINEENYEEFIATANWYTGFLLDYVPSHGQDNKPIVQEDKLRIIPLSIYNITLEHSPSSPVPQEIKTLLKEYFYRKETFPLHNYFHTHCRQAKVL